MAENPILTRLKKKRQQQGTGSIRDEIMSFAENKPIQKKSTGTDFRASAQEAANRLTRPKVFNSSSPSRSVKVNKTEDDYETRREGLRSTAQKEDLTNQRIFELKKVLEKPPTSRMAAVTFQQAQQELQQLQSQKSGKVDPINLFENQVPPSVDKLDTKLDNISKSLKSGSESLGYNIKEGWLQGKVQDWLSTEYYRKMNGLPNQADKVEKFMEDHPDLQASYSQKGLQNFLKRATRGITQNAPMWIGGAKEGAVQGAGLALGFAGVTAAAGNASPLVVVPEEAITVPIAATLGFRFGMSKGMAEYVARQEASLAYMQYVQSGVDPEIAKPLAETVGVFNGVIEVAQVGTLVKSVPGVKDFIKNASKMATKEAAKKLAKIAASYGHEVGENVLEEMLQQGNTDIGGEIAKVVHEGKTGEQLKRMSFKEIAGDVLQTGLQAAVDFSLMPLGGVMKDIGSHIIKTETDKAKAIQTAKQEEQVKTAFRKAIHEDIPGSLSEMTQNMDTLKEKDAVSMIALDNEMDKLLEREDLTPEDITQIGTIKKDIGTIVEKVFDNATKIAPEVKFEAPKERPAMITDILSRTVETNLDDLTLEDYKTAQDAGVVEKIATMIQEGNDTSEIGNAIEKDLPKNKRKPEIISGIIDAVDKVNAEADGEILMQKIKNIQAAMKSMPQNDVVTPEEEQKIEDVDKTLQNAPGSNEGVNGVIGQQDTKTQAINENEKNGTQKNKKGQAQKEKQNKSDKTIDKNSELSTEEYKNKVNSTEYVDNLVNNVDKVKVNNEVAAQANPVFKQFKDVVKAITKNPIFNGLTFKFIDQDTTRFWKRSELDEAGYKHLKEGHYQISGQQSNYSDTKRTITLYRSSTKDTIAEEIVHDLQIRMPKIDPELQDMIKAWEENVHAQAAEEGYDIPTGYETFAQAMVFSEMGYAESNPELATLFSVPDEIVDKFNSILGDDLVTALTGKSQSELPKNIRLFNGVSKHVRGSKEYYAEMAKDKKRLEGEADKKLNEEAKRIIAEAIKRSKDIDFRTYADVGGKGKKSILEDYPEFAPFYKDQAQELISDLNQTIKGDSTLVDTPTGKRILKTDRLTSESIIRIKDKTGATYESIGKALQSIVDGKVKTALARKIELIIDDNLTDGYTNFIDETVKANEDYLKLKYGEEGKEAAQVSYQLKEINQEETDKLKPVDTFYSTLQKTLESKMPRRATADQVMSIAKSGAKEEEIKWSGLEDYLEGKDKVDKDDLLQYLKDNNLKIEETVSSKDAAKPSGKYIIDGSWNEPYTKNDVIYVAQTEAEDEDPDLVINNIDQAVEYLNTHGFEVFPDTYSESGTKYDKYVLPGGTNYREMLFTLPMQKDGYESSHWDGTENVLAHTRLQDFTDADGNNILFIEEIQSDWHQEGRKKGYKSKRGKLLNVFMDTDKGEWVATFEGTGEEIMGYIEEQLEQDFVEWKAKNLENKVISSSLVPDAPFKKTWHEFVLKRMIRYAADHGYDGIAWTNGEQQADRYDLSKQIDKLYWFYNKENNTYDLAASKDGQNVFGKNGVPENEIESYVGKDLSKKIVEDQQNSIIKTGDYSGVDLKIGGEGMKGFYDGLVPSFLKKYLKKWKVDIQDVDIVKSDNKYDVIADEGFYGNSVYSVHDNNTNEWQFTSQNKEDADNWIKEHSTIQQPGFMLNDEMKNSAVNEGQPLYQLKEDTQSNFDVNRMSFYGTVEMNPITDPALRAELKRIAGLYKVAHNQDTLKESLDLFYEMGTEAATKWVLGSTPATKEMNMIAQMLIKMNMDNKNFDTAIELVDATARKAKDGGQATQVLSMFGTFTPEGIIRYTRKTYQKLLTEGQVNEVSGKADDLEKQMRDINKKAADDLDIEGAMQEIAKATPEEMLARKIKNTLKDKTDKEFDPVKLMVETLFKVYKETMDFEKEKPIDNTLTFIAHALTEREKYRAVWGAAREIVKEQTKDDPNADAILDPYFDLILTQTFPDSMIEKAVRTGLKDLKLKLDNIVKQHFSEVNRTTETLKQKLINEAGLNGYEALMLEDYIQKTMNKFTAEAKNRVLDRMFKDRNTTAREKKTIAQRILEISNLGGFQSATYKNLIAAKLGFPAMTDEMISSLDYQAQQIQTMEEGHDKDLAVAKMLDLIAAGVPVSFARKLNTLQTMAQLLNPKTIIRNVVGNTGFQGIDRLSRNLMIPLDMFASRLTGTRTKTYIGMTALKDREGSAVQRFGGYLTDLLLGEGFREGWDIGLQDALAGVNTSGLNTQYDLQQGRAYRKKEGKFINNAISSAETVMNIALRATDRAAFMSAFTESINEQMKIAKVTEATQDMIDIATSFGLYRTFQDANKVSDFFVSIKKALNKVGSKEFGLGDLILKYPKTPGNLLARAIDFSPLGVINVAFKLFFDVNDGKSVYRAPSNWKYQSEATKYLMQKQAVEGIGRAVTGTMLIGSGYLLAKLGIIAGKGDDDWDIYYMNQLAGLDKYQINYSALLRWIGSGFNAESAARQQGDTLFNYDWFLPFSTGIVVGADLANRVKSYLIIVGDDKTNVIKAFDDKVAANNFITENKGKNYKVLSSTDGIGFVGSVISAIQVGTETLANQPLLSGIQKAFSSRNPVDGIAEILKSTPAGFVPTLFSQITQLVDNEKKSTYDIKWTGESMRLVQRKIPGLASNLEPNLDVFGDPQRYYANNSNPIIAALYTFFSPAFVQKYNPSPEAKFVLDMYDKYGDKKTVPKKVTKKLTVEGVTINLTPAELTTLQKYSGQMLKERLSKEEQQDTEALSEKAQIKRIDNIYDEVYTEVKEKIRKMRGIPKKQP